MKSDSIPSSIEVVSIARWVVSAMKLHAWRLGKVVVLEVSEPEAWAFADAEKLEQALVNLIHSAVCHTLPGGVVAVSLQSQEEGIIIRVEDTNQVVYLPRKTISDQKRLDDSL